jgi:rhodanese-related sulfurtransferase
MPELNAVLPVNEMPAADAQSAQAHFQNLLRFETDCWDVHASLQDSDGQGADRRFVVLDVRSPDLYATGHVPGAINLPHRLINERRLASYPPDTLFVVYCAGPHCNGADKAALRLARLARPVKKMIGGIEGWKDDGFALATD